MPSVTPPRPARPLALALLIAVLAASASVPSADAQGARGEAPFDAPRPAAVQEDSMAVFVRTHLALQALRDRMQAEMAEPRNKKDEEQQALRDRLRSERARILKEHAMTEQQFARMTRWVSVDDSARKLFDGLVARAGGKGS